MAAIPFAIKDAAAYRAHIRSRPILTIHDAPSPSRRVLVLLSGENISVLDGPKVQVHGHWEPEHFIANGERWRIAYLFDDTSPESLAKFVTKNCDIVINCIADPDLHGGTLRVAESVAGMVTVPFVNAPSKILKHSRDAIAEALAAVDGAVIPAVTREANQRPFPRIARLAGTQTGETMALLSNEGDLHTFERDRDGRNAYFTEFFDFRSSDGFYRKFRVRMVNGQIVPNHLFFGQSWKVHGGSARPLMFENKWMLQEEVAFLNRQHPSFTAATQNTLREIHRRIGVDFYGVDFGILPDGRLLFFEANAAMRSIYPEWSASLPFTATVTSDLVSRFRNMLGSRPVR